MEVGRGNASGAHRCATSNVPMHLSRDVHSRPGERRRALSAGRPPVPSGISSRQAHRLTTSCGMRAGDLWLANRCPAASRCVRVADVARRTTVGARSNVHPTALPRLGIVLQPPCSLLRYWLDTWSMLRSYTARARSVRRTGARVPRGHLPRERPTVRRNAAAQLA